MRTPIDEITRCTYCGEVGYYHCRTCKVTFRNACEECHDEIVHGLVVNQNTHFCTSPSNSLVDVGDWWFEAYCCKLVKYLEDRGWSAVDIRRDVVRGDDIWGFSFRTVRYL